MSEADRAAIERCFADFTAGIDGFGPAETGAPDLLGRTKLALLTAIRTVQLLPRDHWVWQPGYYTGT